MYEEEYQTKVYCLRPYIAPEASVHLKQHKYSGCDDGIAYKYFWNPVAGYLVTLLPDYVAPNTLTMIGFMHAIVPLGVLYTFCGTSFMGDVPLWFIIL